MQTEVNKIISFLDVLIDNSQNIFKTLTYHNYNSFTPHFYKIGLIKCLIDRAYKFKNTWPSFHHDVSKIKDILKRNSYPTFLNNIAKTIMSKLYSLHLKYAIISISKMPHPISYGLFQFTNLFVQDVNLVTLAKLVIIL